MAQFVLGVRSEETPPTVFLPRERISQIRDIFKYFLYLLLAKKIKKKKKESSKSLQCQLNWVGVAFSLSRRLRSEAPTYFVEESGKTGAGLDGKNAKCDSPTTPWGQIYEALNPGHYILGQITK